MVPSQIHYNDLLTRILAGFLFCFCAYCLIHYFFSDVTIQIFTLHTGANTQEFLLVYIPIIFCISYAVGTALGSSQFLLAQISLNTKREQYIDGSVVLYIISRVLFRFVFAIHRFKEDPRISPLVPNKNSREIDRLIKEQVFKKYRLNLNFRCYHENVDKSDKTAEKKNREEKAKLNKELNRIFEACSSYVEINSKSFAVLEIQRHHTLMHFKSQLAYIFVLCFFGCISATIKIFYPVIFIFYPVVFKFNNLQLLWAFLNEQNIFSYLWLISTFVAYYLVRKCGNGSLRDWRKVCRETYLAFYHCITSKENAEEEDSLEILIKQHSS